MAIRLAILADGDPIDPKTNSGVAASLVEAFRLDTRLEVVRARSAAITGWRRTLVRVLAFHPSPQRWRSRASWGTTRPWVRSISRAFSLGRVGRVDYIVHVRGVYRPTRRPYVAFIDSTIALRREHWPPSGAGERDLARLVAAEGEYLRSAAAVFVAGDYLVEHLVAAYSVQRERIKVVGAGQRYSDARTLAELPEADHAEGQSPPTRAPRILFVGRDFQRKGGDLLVAAFAQVRKRFPSSTLVLVGSPTVPSGEGIEVYGDVTPAVLDDIYRSATLFCLPARFEPFGIALLEAMAHGLPCVVSDYGALPTVVENAAAGVVVPRNPEAIASALLGLLDEPERAAELGARAFAYGREQTWERVTSRIVSTLEELQG